MERAFGPRGDNGRWWNSPKVVEKLKLTDDQRKAMDQILLQHRETLIDLRGNVEKAELLMEPLMKDDQPNETKILAQIDKIAWSRAELEKANARFLLALRGKLTPEQWKQLQAERTERRGWEQGRGRQEGGPGPGQGRDGQGRDGQGTRRQFQHQPPPPPDPATGPATGPAAGPQSQLDDIPGMDSAAPDSGASGAGSE
jgi:Spy/CpxP family protein refolding chaperone